MQLHGDVTSKASQAALNKLGFGVNMLGSHFAPLSYSLMPAETESARAYTQAYRASKQAIRKIIALPCCTKEDCKTCLYIKQLREHPNVAKILTDDEYCTGDKRLPISKPLGDNSAAFQKFARDELGECALVCQTHATAIAANNGSHRSHFKDEAVYEEFYDYVCRIMRISCATTGEYLQMKLVEWLREKGEDDAANWFQEWWVGPEKGRWTLGHGGIAMSGNNQGLESTWRWDRESISRSLQVNVFENMSI